MILQRIIPLRVVDNACGWDERTNAIPEISLGTNFLKQKLLNKICKNLLNNLILICYVSFESMLKTFRLRQGWILANEFDFVFSAYH